MELKLLTSLGITNSMLLLIRITGTNLHQNSRLMPTYKKMELKLLTSLLTQPSAPTNSNWLLLTSSVDGEFLNLPLMSQWTIKLVVAWLLMPISLEDFILKLHVGIMPKVGEMCLS